MDIDGAIEEFLCVCVVERQLSRHTIQAYASDLGDFRKWLRCRARLSDVSEVTLNEYLGDLVGTRKLGSATVRRRFACLRTFFHRQAVLGRASNPFARWKLQLPRRRRLPRTLTSMETSVLLSALRQSVPRKQLDHDVGFGIATRLMVSTGVRVGELCRLRVQDFSADASSFRVHGKGSRDRIIFVTDYDLRNELRSLIRSRRAGGAEGLFLNRDRGIMSPQTIRLRLRRYAKKLGLLRNVTPHMLRHTAATLLIETGVDIRFVQRLLGHSSIATTEIYTHISDEALRLTLERANVLARFTRP